MASDKQLCIYCQSAPQEHLDHTFPRNWWPAGIALEVQRLTVPACNACGGRLKKAEEQAALAWIMARGFDRDHPAAAGVYERVRKTWDAAAAKTPRERRHRLRRQQSILSRVQPVVVPRDAAIGTARVKARTAAGLIVDATVALKFHRSDLDAIGEKFVRGLCHQLFGKLLPLGTTFTAFEPDAKTMQIAGQELPGAEPMKGFAYRYFEFGDGREFWFFYVWEQVVIGVLVEPPSTGGTDAGGSAGT